jgi:hypothetical protein
MIDSLEVTLTCPVCDRVQPASVQTHLFFGEGLSLRIGDEVENFAAMRHRATKYFRVTKRPWDPARLLSIELWRCRHCKTDLAVRAEFADGKFAGAKAIVPSCDDVRAADLFHSDLDERVFVPAVKQIHPHADAEEIRRIYLWDILEGIFRGDLGLDDDDDDD